jgi:SAM-dependent methyltransferase
MKINRMFIFCLLLIADFLSAAQISSNAVVFSDIYERGEWGVDENKKGNSGTGSSPQNARMYIAYLQNYLNENNIHSVVDLGCGDWRVGREINWEKIQYLGIDVVESVINQNVKNYASANIAFIKADGTEYNLPAADLLICKDVFQHLPYKDIQNILKQFGKFKHCIVINDVDPVNLTCENKDIPRGHYRYLDISKPPFSLLGRKVLTYASGDETKQVIVINN